MSASENRPFPVIFFRTQSGNEPVREWLKELPQEERKAIGEDVKTLQFRWPLGMPLVRPLADKIYEIRTGLPNRTARTLFCVENGVIILLHGFIKKTRGTPADDLTLAKKRKREYLNADEDE